MQKVQFNEQDLRRGKSFEVGNYHVWFFNKFRADQDWSKSENESERHFSTFSKLQRFLESLPDETDPVAD